MNREPGRRALCVGIPRFGPDDVEPATDAPIPLPFASRCAREVAAALAELGYSCTSGESLELRTAEELGGAVKTRLKSGMPGDVEVIHALTHGRQAGSGLYLVGPDGETDSETEVAHWISTVQSHNGPTALFLLDTCHAGAAARLDWLRAADHESKAWVIAATTQADLAYDGAFSTAVAQVLTEIADGRLDVYPSRYVPFGVLVEQIRRRVAQIGVREQIVTGTPVDGAPEPPFVVNPHQPADPGVAQAAQDSDEVLRPFLDLEVSLDAAHFADRAAGRRLDQGLGQGVFTGRGTLLRELSGWLRDGDSPLRVVTGEAGSGKSAVLGMLVCAGHPRLRAATARLRAAVAEADLPPVLPSLVAVHLRERDLRAAVDGLRRQLDLADSPAPGSDEHYAAATVADLGELAERPVIVVDALDEAVGQQTLMRHLLLPLARARRPDGSPACRLLVGTRPWQEFEPLLSLAGERSALADLDTTALTELRRELDDYVKDLLSTGERFSLGERRTIAAGVTAALTAAGRPRGGEFLAAALYANALLEADPAWLDGREAAVLAASVPATVPELLDFDLSRPSNLRDADPAQRWSRPILAAIASARGSGIPASVIRRLAPAMLEGAPGEDLPDTLSSDELRAGLARVRFYLRSAPGSDGLTVYRPFHQSLVDHLRPADDSPQAADRLGAIFDRLVQPAPAKADSSRDWHAAEPYVREHWIEHALDGGRLEEVLQADPAAVRAACNTHLSTLGRRSSAIWQATEQSQPSGPGQRRDLMALNAARYGNRQIALRLCADKPWWPMWSTSGQLQHSRLLTTLTGHSKPVRSVVCTVFDGRSVAISSDDRTVRIWDLTSGEQIGQTTTGLDSGVSEVAGMALHGRPVAVTGGGDGKVRVRDLTGGKQIGQTMTGHVGPVTSVGCTMLNGRPVGVTGGLDETVRVWDLTTCEQIGQAKAGHDGPVNAVACTMLNGRPVAVTGSSDRTVRIWDLTSGEQIGEPLTGHNAWISAVACTMLNDRPIAVTGSSDRTVRIWDLTSGKQIGEPLTGHRDWVSAVACTVADSGTIAISSDNETVWIWDLNRGKQIGHPVTGHDGPVTAVACTMLNGRPVGVTGGQDQTVRIWDLTTSEQIGQAKAGHDGPVTAVASTVLDGRPAAVTGGRDKTVRIWDLASGEQIGRTRLGYRGTVHYAVACTVLDDRPIAVTGSHDKMIRIWDLDLTGSGQIGRTRLGIRSTVHYAVACTMLDDHPVAVTGGGDGTVRIWDLTNARQIGQPMTGHDGPVYALACTDLDDHPIAVTGSHDRTVRIWDLTASQQIGEPMAGHDGPVSTVACAMLHDRPVAVTGSHDRTVRIWDLTSGEQIGEPMTGHNGPVSAAACTMLDDGPIAVTGGGDRTVRVWDLTVRQVTSTLAFPSRTESVAFADQTLIVGYGNEVACFARFPSRRNL